LNAGKAERRPYPLSDAFGFKKDGERIKAAWQGDGGGGGFATDRTVSEKASRGKLLGVISRDEWPRGNGRGSMAERRRTEDWAQ